MSKRKPVILFILWFIFITGQPVGAAQAVPDKIPASDEYIKVDLMSKRLFLFQRDQMMKSYPIALGKKSTPSPAGVWKVINKHKNWGKGFGTRWIGLNVPWGTYGIHGTNTPGSIGRDITHGCIRMFNRDVEDLYERVHIGMNVYILGHPLGKTYEDPRRLARGDSGAEVMLVQNRLKSAGYFHGVVNGKFTWQTETALKQYEGEHHLPVDGILGSQDYLALGLVE